MSTLSTLGVQQLIKDTWQHASDLLNVTLTMYPMQQSIIHHQRLSTRTALARWAPRLVVIRRRASGICECNERMQQTRNMTTVTSADAEP